MSINVGGDPVENEQEALFLMLHHLRLAALYFEATPKVISSVPDTFSQHAIRAWLAEMEALYPEEDY